MLPERGNKQQQQQLSQKESRRPRSKRSVHESEMPKVAPKGTKHRPSSAALPAAVPHRPCRRAPPHPPPPQHPARRRMAAASSAVAPQSRRQASDIALRRRACASPTLSMRALPALTPCARRLNTPSEPARGSSYRPRPLQRGAQQRHHRWLYQSFHQSLLVARGAPVIFPTHLNFDLKNDPHSRGGPDSRG